MTTKVNGVEITHCIAEVLAKWYAHEMIEDTQPAIYSRWLLKIQDYLTRIWVDMEDDDDDIPRLKECTNMLLQIKDDFERLIPDKNSES